MKGYKGLELLQDSLTSNSFILPFLAFLLADLVTVYFHERLLKELDFKILDLFFLLLSLDFFPKKIENKNMFVLQSHCFLESKNFKNTDTTNMIVWKLRDKKPT